MENTIEQIAKLCESPDEFLIKLKDRQHELWMKYAGREFPLNIIQELKEISSLVSEIVLHKTKSSYTEFGGMYREYWESVNEKCN